MSKYAFTGSCDGLAPWAYLEGLEAAPDAPISDNPSGLYCPDCRGAGMAHCAHVDTCGGMRPMRAALKRAGR